MHLFIRENDSSFCPNIHSLSSVNAFGHRNANKTPTIRLLMSSLGKHTGMYDGIYSMMVYMFATHIS